MKPYATRYVKVTLKVAVGVYLPKDSGADRAAPDDALRVRLQSDVNWYSDGRNNSSVEQIQNAAEDSVRCALRRLVEDHFREKGERQIQRVIEQGGRAAEWAQNKLEDDVALAMAHVSVGETPVSDEHTLEVEIEGDP